MKLVKSLSFTFLSVFLAPTLQKNTPFFENINNEIIRLKYAQLICKPVRSEKKKIVRVTVNGPFPSCCLSRFRSESWCSTIVREMGLICITIRNSFPFEWLCTRTR